MKKKYFFTIFLLFCLTNKAFAKDYSIEDLLKIAEQNSLIKAAEFSAISQKNFANQQKYWENPIVSFNQNSNQKNYLFCSLVP